MYAFFVLSGKFIILQTFCDSSGWIHSARKCLKIIISVGDTFPSVYCIELRQREIDGVCVREEGYGMLHVCVHINKPLLCCLATKYFSFLASYYIN